MSYEVSIVADSVSPAGARITTFQLRFPRFILAQFNTHRAISRNARSSRAVPIEKMIAEVENDPVIPICWGKNRKGMQATKELSDDDVFQAKHDWLCARDDAILRVRDLMDRSVHKQIANRLLEPFMWVDVVATATDWSNFFALRCDRMAMPEIQVLAVKMARTYRDSTPTPLETGWWHLPYVTADELAALCSLRMKTTGQHSFHDNLVVAGETRRLLKLSTARCARVSYRTFEGKAPDPEADIALHDRLEASGHFSPFEHAAMALQLRGERSGNFNGWLQYRQSLPVSVHKDFDFARLDEFEGKDFIV